MKKILFLLLLLPLLGGGLLSAQTVSNLAVIPGAAGSASTVTFDVSWDKATLTTPWLDSMWVFVDYNNNGKMERLLISGGTLTEHTATKAGTGEFIPENDMGAWVYGDARTNAAGSFSAKVELYTKETDIIIAGACAYASSYPPVGQYISTSEIVFTGTPMYEIKLLYADGNTVETIESGGTFLLPCSYTMSSFTDKTGAPGIINCKPPTALTLATPFTTVCASATVTLTASATGAASYSIDGTNWQTSPVFNVPAASNESYTLYAQTEEGCVATLPNAAVVTVNPLPTGLTLAATPTTICKDESATLTASATGGASYSINNSTWQTSPDFEVSPTLPTAYTLYVKTAAGCSATQASAAVVTVAPSGGNGQAPTACGCAIGLTPCKNICTVSACNFTACDGFTEMTTAIYEGKMTWSDANEYCTNKGSGWRLPNGGELPCMCDNAASLPGGMSYSDYWQSTPYLIQNYHYTCIRRPNDCMCTGYPDKNTFYFKCVR
jgi:hypothetical protein